MKGNPLFSKALEYTVRGYSVMPLRRNKIPLLPSWKKYQTVPATDGEISAFWTKTPQANIGIITGKVSGITVVDIDRKDNAQVNLDVFPPTFTVETPTGGYHLYYQYCPDIQQTANTFPHLPNVDIRNDGGYVVAPPSFCDYVKHGTRTVGTYKVHAALPVAPFPLSVFNLPASTAKPSKKKKLSTFKDMGDGDGRNDALTSAIGRLLKLTAPADYEAVAWPVALALNAQFKEPLPEREVRATFDSIAKKETSKPLADTEFLKSDKGVVIVNEENVYRTICADPNLAGKFRHNIFGNVDETCFEDVSSTWTPIQRADIVALQMYLMRTYAHYEHVPHGCVEDALMHYTKNNRVSPPVEWLRALTWDGTPRLDDWLTAVYGVPQDTYHRAVASNWLKGLVKRIVQPGCKFDYVMVLEGEQGMRKSTSLAVLGGDWYVETVFAPDDKDFFMLMSGKAIVEFSEGETLSRTEAKRMKAVITMQHDKYRPPYERVAKEFPRQCVFAMTTNQDQYLKDETGNRRWLPVKCMKMADIDWLVANRNQLFAEAYHRAITLAETTWEFPEEETRAQQQARQAVDPREEQIYDWYFKALTAKERNEGITTRQAYIQGVQGLEMHSAAFGKEVTRKEEMVIGSILTSSLMLERRRVRENMERFYRYFPSKKTLAMQPEDVNIDGIAVPAMRF